MKPLSCFAGLVSLSFLVPVACRADDQPAGPVLPAEVLQPLVARPLGPANMGGRVTSLAVVEKRPTTFYVGTASGGLWKTVNAGITWTPIFDDQPTSAIGAVAVAPSDPDVIWVGTGEANPRNSVSWGTGVYRSTDAGKTWTYCGLRESHHIGKIVVDPRDPQTAYVAALGHLWGPNRRRGVFKTTDGGKSWDHVLALDEETGCIDLAISPGDPEVLFAAAYRVRRGPYSGGNPAVMWGPAAGLYRTKDGGKNWERLRGGLPDRPYGRCGIDICRKEPRIVYAIVQTDKTSILVTPGQAAAPGSKPDTGGVFRSEDGGDTWVKLNDLCPRPFYFGQIRVDPGDDRTVYVLGIALHISRDGGRHFTGEGAVGTHADHHAMWIDPADTNHMILGCDGGLFLSHDRGKNWEHVRNLPLAQVYGAAVDMRKPYRVYVGLQDNGSWGGPSRTNNRDGITVADWFRILGADGFHCRAEPANSDIVYAESQYGGLARINVRTGVETSIRPSTPTPLSPSFRFNWSSPILLSPHNGRIVYFGGNHLFRSLDRGEFWEVLGPDLTRGRPGASADQGHTITTIAESPVKANVLWVGTDDGRVQLSRNGGVEWTDVGANLRQLPAEHHVSHIECSPFAAGTAWVTIDRHRQDDLAPYVLRTEDYGAHWKLMVEGLPARSPVYVLCASSRNRELLFAGTETGLFVTGDGGKTWQPLKVGMPTVPVHDLVLHPRDRELVIATHGRGVFVLDVWPLEELTPSLREREAHLLEVRPAIAFEDRPGRGLGGGKTFSAPNPPAGAAIWYHLRDRREEAVKVEIADPLGRKITDIKGGSGAGLHLVHWNLRGGAGIDLRGARLAAPGDYTARLMIGGRQIMARKLRVEAEE